MTLQNNWELLAELSEKYQKTQSQVILNWMCELGYKPMVFSTSKNHIDENLSSVDFKMSGNDYQRLTDFRPQKYTPPEIDWEGTGIDDDIVLLAKDFEQHITA
jgi:diketogulonate reductase-like aldo/keto reductase